MTATEFEPATFPTRCAVGTLSSKLRYAPTLREGSLVFCANLDTGQANCQTASIASRHSHRAKRLAAFHGGHPQSVLDSWPPKLLTRPLAWVRARGPQEKSHQH